MRCAELGLIFCSFVVDVVSHPLAEDTLEVVGTSLIQRSLSLQKAHPWIGKNGDVLRQGSTTAVAATHLRKGAAWNWTAPLRGLVRASPVIDAEGSIYLSSINGVIYKFNQHGKELWQTNTGRGLPGNPVLYENSLFAVQDDCTFLALDPSNGKERWRAKGGDVFGPDTPSIIAEGGRVFTACCDASEQSNIGGATYVVAMDASNGQKLWTMRPENKVYNFLASVVDDSLLFADLAGGVYRLATSDGKVIWSHSAPEHASLGTGGLTTAPNGIAYVTTNTKDPSIGASRGVLSAYFITDGKLLWQKSLPLSANSGAAIGQKSPNTYFVTVALGPNPALPLPFPPKAFLDIEPLSPSTKDGLKPGKAMTFDAGSGEVLWSFDFPDWHGVAAGDTVDHLCLPVMILIAISPIAFREGFRPFCTVVVYLACLSLVKMWVKETMNAGLQYPDSITALHMLCTSLAAASFERPRLSEAWLVLPISVVNGASLLTNNTALLHGGVAFVSMVSSCSPMFTFLLELCRRRRTLDFLTAFSVVLVCSGSAFCVRGEKTASLLALLFASMAALLRAMKSVWQHELLTISVSPMRLVFWSGFWSFWITISMVAMNEGTEALRHFPHANPEAKSAFLCSIGAAVVLNITQCFAVKQLGALLQSIVGNLNLILVIALSQAWLQEKVSFWQYVGVLLLAAGTFTNKYGDLQKSPPKADEKAKLVKQAEGLQAAPEEPSTEQVHETNSETSTYGATEDASGSEEVKPARN